MMWLPGEPSRRLKVRDGGDETPQGTPHCAWKNIAPVNFTTPSSSERASTNRGAPDRPILALRRSPNQFGRRPGQVPWTSQAREQETRCRGKDRQAWACEDAFELASEVTS